MFRKRYSALNTQQPGTRFTTFAMCVTLFTAVKQLIDIIYVDNLTDTFNCEWNMKNVTAKYF